VFLEGVEDVFEEDEAEDDVLVFRRVHIVAELVGVSHVEKITAPFSAIEKKEPLVSLCGIRFEDYRAMKYNSSRQCLRIGVRA
jgi:hypothetical protein